MTSSHNRQARCHSQRRRKQLPAKKNPLTKRFNDNVLPQARRLRTANARMKRTSKGIENLPVSQSTDNDEEEEEDDDEQEEEEAPLPLLPSSIRSTGRSTKARTEEDEEVGRGTICEDKVSRLLKGTLRRYSSKHARTVDRAEADTALEPKRPVCKRLCQGAQTLVVKQETAGESNYCYPNPSSSEI